MKTVRTVRLHVYVYLKVYQVATDIYKVTKLITVYINEWKYILCLFGSLKWCIFKVCCSCRKLIYTLKEARMKVGKQCFLTREP